MKPEEVKAQLLTEEKELAKKLRLRGEKLRIVILQQSCIVLLVLSLVLLLYFILSNVDQAWSGPAAISVLVSIVFFVSAMVLLKQVSAQAQAATEEIAAVSENQLQTLLDTLDVAARRSVKAFAGSHALAAEAAGLLKRARQDKNDERIVFISIGAPSLAQAPKNSDTPADSRLAKSHDDYAAEQALVTKNRLRMERYINLINQDAYAGRGPDFRKRYMGWITRQIQLLNDNPEYWLLDCQRAPRWGATTSWLFIGCTALQIMGDGVSGTLITGDEEVANIRVTTLDYMQSGQNRPERVTAEALADYRKHLLATRPTEASNAA